MTDIVKIDSLAYLGAGVGRIEGKAVFVPYSAPGDVARVEITTDKKSYSNASIVEILECSPLRTTPACPVFGLCGGCQWQHIAYTGQVEWKQQIFIETLKRLGRVDVARLDPPVASPEEYGYRTRARFHVRGSAWGFFEGASRRVVDIETCPLLDPIVNECFRAIKEKLSAVTASSRAVTALHSIEVGSDGIDNKAAAAFHVKNNKGLDWHGALKDIECLKGFEVWISDPAKRGRGRRILREGDTRLFERTLALTLGSGVTVFSQANRLQNQQLVQRVVDMARGDGGGGIDLSRSVALDLYSGSGNFALALAEAGARVLGVDSNPEAIRDAKENARSNGLAEVRFIRERAGIKKTLDKLKPDVVILDPPRGGGLGAIKAVAGARPKRVIYVSCSPPTLARDAAYLTGRSYALARAGVIDMFPHSYHIEGVVAFDLKT